MTLHSTPASPDPAALVASLIGTPWAERAVGPDAYDCWGLAVHVQAALWGRELPWSGMLIDDARAIREVIGAIRASALQRSWVAVSHPRPGDLVLMTASVYPSHVGVWVDAGPGLTGILHCERRAGVVLDTLAQARAGWARLEFRRSIGRSLEAIAGTDPRLAAHWAEAPLAILVADPLDPLTGAELVEVAAGTSVRDAVAGLYTPADRWVCLNDMPLMRCCPETGADEWDTPLTDGDLLWILPLPPEGGDRGSQVLATVLTIVAAIAAPALVGGLGSAALGTRGALTFTGKLLSAGIAIGANALISSFLPQPATPAPLADPEPTYSFGQVQNRIRPGATVPRVYGSMRRVPDLLAPPWAEYEDNTQILHVLLCVSQGQVRLNSFGVVDTPVWTREEGYTGAVADIEHEVVEPGAVPTLFPSAVEVNAEVEGIELPEPDPDEAVLGPYTAVSAGRRATRIVCDFLFPRGLFTNAAGIGTTTVTWRIEIREIDDAGTPQTGWSVLDTPSRSAASTTPLRLTLRYDVAPGRYQVRTTRSSASTISGAGAQDGLYFGGLRAHLAEPAPLGDVTALAIRVRADASSSSGLQEWYVDATAVLPRPDPADEDATITEATEAIDAAVYDIVTADYGLALDPARIDMPELRRLAAVWAARGDVCCTSIESEISAWDALEKVLVAGRTRPQMIGGMVTFVRDEARAAPSRLITQADMVRGSFAIERVHRETDSPNVVRMRWRDRAGAMRSIECRPDGVAVARPATVTTEVMVDVEQVWREGLYMAASNNLRRRFVSWIMLDGARALVRGQLVEIAHPRPDYGRPARLAWADWPDLGLSDVHGLGEGEPGWMTIAHPDGAPWGPVRVTAGAGDRRTVHVDEEDFQAAVAAQLPGPYADDPRDWMIAEQGPRLRADATRTIGTAQADATRVVLGTDTVRTLRCLIVEVLPGEDGRCEVLAVEEAAAVHDADQSPLPADHAALAALSNAARPVWGDVTVLGTEDGSGGVDLHIAGPPVAGAVRYVAEIATSVAAADWSAAGSAETPSFAGPTITTDVSVRVRAETGVLNGPWAHYRTQIGAAVDGKSVAIPEAA